MAKPKVQLKRKLSGRPSTKLDWYTIDRYNQYAGDLLAAFELFLVSAHFILTLFFMFDIVVRVYNTLLSMKRNIVQVTFKLVFGDSAKFMF